MSNWKDTRAELQADRIRKIEQRERTAWDAGYDHAIRGGSRLRNPYKRGHVFGAHLHRSWDRGWQGGRDVLNENERMDLDV